MAFSTQDTARELIAYTVVTDKGSLIKLLQRNGVVMPNDASDRQVTVAVLTASGKSPNFKNELSRLLTSKVKKAGEDYSSFVGDSSDFGFTGIDDYSFTGIDDFVSENGEPSTKSKKAPKVKTPKTPKPAKVVVEGSGNDESSDGQTVFGRFLRNLGTVLGSEETINTGLNLGLTALNNRMQGRENSIYSESDYLTQRQNQLRNQMNYKQNQGSGSGTIIIVIVGILAIGATIYFLTKKK